MLMAGAIDSSWSECEWHMPQIAINWTRAVDYCCSSVLSSWRGTSLSACEQCWFIWHWVHPEMLAAEIGSCRSGVWPSTFHSATALHPGSSLYRCAASLGCGTTTALFAWRLGISSEESWQISGWLLISCLVDTSDVYFIHGDSIFKV